eukprot:819693_1
MANIINNKPKSKVWCEFVHVKESTLSTDNIKFDGAFAAKDFSLGEVVEFGLMRRLPENFDGHKDQFVFTWSDEIPNKVWAQGSGCSTFYNTGRETANCKMIRDFENDRFTIVAIKDIQKDDELFHQYKSLDWRTCFEEVARFSK